MESLMLINYRENDIKNRWYSAALRKKRKPEDTIRSVNDYYTAATSLKMLCKEGYASNNTSYVGYHHHPSSSSSSINYNNSYGNMQQENNPFHGNNDGVGDSLLKSINVSEVSPFIYHHQHHHYQQHHQQQQQQDHRQSIHPPEMTISTNISTDPLDVPSTLQNQKESISTSENTSDSDPFIYNHHNFFFRNRSANNSNNNSGYTSPSSTLYNALLSACQSPSWLDNNFQDDKPA